MAAPQPQPSPLGAPPPSGQLFSQLVFPHPKIALRNPNCHPPTPFPLACSRHQLSLAIRYSAKGQEDCPLEPPQVVKMLPQALAQDWSAQGRPARD
jgi:hypothetical protein